MPAGGAEGRPPPPEENPEEEALMRPRGPVAGALTCDDCGEVYDEPYTIVECLCTFCRGCLDMRWHVGILQPKGRPPNVCPRCPHVMVGPDPYKSRKVIFDTTLMNIVTKLFPERCVAVDERRRAREEKENKEKKEREKRKRPPPPPPPPPPPSAPVPPVGPSVVVPVETAVEAGSLPPIAKRTKVEEALLPRVSLLPVVRSQVGAQTGGGAPPATVDEGARPAGEAAGATDSEPLPPPAGAVPPAAVALSAAVAPAAVVPPLLQIPQKHDANVEEAAAEAATAAEAQRPPLPVAPESQAPPQVATGSLKIQLRMPRPQPQQFPARDPEELRKTPRTVPAGAGKKMVPTVARLPTVVAGAAQDPTEVTFALHPHPGSCLQEMQKPFLKVKASLRVRQVARYVVKKLPVAPGLEEGGLQLCAAVGGGALPEDLMLGDLSWPAPPAGGALPGPRVLRYCLANEQLGAAKGGSSCSGGAAGTKGDVGGGCMAGAAPGAAAEGVGGQEPPAPPPG